MIYQSIFNVAKFYSKAVIKFARGASEYWIRPDGSTMDVDYMHSVTAINMLFDGNKMMQLIKNYSDTDPSRPVKSNIIYNMLRTDGELAIHNIQDECLLSTTVPTDLAFLKTCFNNQYKTDEDSVEEAWLDPVRYMCTLGWIRIRRQSIEMDDLNNPERKKTLKTFVDNHLSYYRQYLSNPLWITCSANKGRATIFSNISEYFDSFGKDTVPEGLSDTQFFHRMYDSKRKEPGLEETRPGWVVSKRIDRLNKLAQIIRKDG